MLKGTSPLERGAGRLRVPATPRRGTGGGQRCAGARCGRGTARSGVWDLGSAKGA